MNLKILSIIAIITLTLLFFSRSEEFQLTIKPEPEPTIIKDDIYSFMSGVAITTTDESGKPVRVLKTDSLRHYRVREKTVLENPQLELIERNNQKLQMTSSKGEFYGDDLATFSDQVKVTIKQEDGNAIEIKTDKLHYDIESEQLYTDSIVEMKMKSGQLSSRGMRADVSSEVHQ